MFYFFLMQKAAEGEFVVFMKVNDEESFAIKFPV